MSYFRYAGSSAPHIDPNQPATDNQMEFIRNLGRDREIGMDVEDFNVMLSVWIEAGLCTKGFISSQIEEYKSKPYRPTVGAEPGYYVSPDDDKFYVVVQNKAKTNTYAKVLTKVGNKWTWEYAPGMGRKLASMTPMIIDVAAAWGHLHGQWLVCLRPLTDPESVKAGLGPVCAKRIKKEK